MTDSSPQVAENGKIRGSENKAPIVVIKQLAKQFGKLSAIDNLNMTINTGETYGLIGPNGSGKTTLIRMMVGLSRPTAGTVDILGERMPSPKVSPELGYMPQLSA